MLQFHQWTLSNFIDVAHELGLLKVDVKRFSHSLRDLTPDEHTAKILFQVLKAALFQLLEQRINK